MNTPIDLAHRHLVDDGEIGKSVGCNIYPLRSSTCHDCEAGSEKCNRAQLRHGLPDTKFDNDDTEEVNQ